MRCNFRIYLSSWIAGLLFVCFANVVHSYGIECEKPVIASAINATSSFNFDCFNSTGVTFASYKIFPVCLEGACDTASFTATGCPYAIPPGGTCEVQGSFTPTEASNYVLDFNDRYASVPYSNIFCNDPSKGCIHVDGSLAPFAYVPPNPGTAQINQCGLDTSNGEFLSPCAIAYSDNGNPQTQFFGKLTFGIVNGVQFGYVTDQGGFVYQCTINATGGFDNCRATTPSLISPNPPTSWAPHDIAFATVSGTQYAYVTDVDQGYIFQCSLDSTGNFTTCSAMTSISNFAAPYGINFATFGGIQYAYIADAGFGPGYPGYIYQCKVNNDGSFQTCNVMLGQNAPDWIPYGIDFATVNEVQYAYVADNGTSATTGHVYRCTLNPDGSFAACTSSPNSPTANWVPSDIAFATLDGTQYAYVPCSQGSTLGAMYSCTLNSIGFFGTCTSTPSPAPDPWSPVGIAFRFN